MCEVCIDVCVCVHVCVLVCCAGGGGVVCREDGMHVRVCVGVVWVIYVRGSGMYIGRMVCVCGVVFVCVVFGCECRCCVYVRYCIRYCIIFVSV